MFVMQQTFMPRSRTSHNEGFTILELLIASTVFAVILLVVAVGAIQFTNSYYKGVTSSKTQAAARDIMSEISQSIEFGKSASVSTGSGGAGWLCVDNTLYSYVIGQEVVDSSPNGALHQAYHGLVKSTGGSCAGQTPALPTISTLAASQRELLGRQMRLGDLTITNVGNVYTIRVKILFGDDDLFTPTVSGGTNWALETCAGGRAGTQFCGVSDLTTTVERRLL